jgi:hypothetical protein
LNPESILKEIWYGSWGLHLIGAPIYVFKKNFVGLGQSHFALDHSQVALTSYSNSNGALSNFTTSRKVWLTWVKAHLPSTRGLLMRSGTMGTMSHGLGQKKQEGLP